jgi:organic radical activating enzyme
MTNVPDSFCLLPWIHAHVGAQGQRKLCCIDVSRERDPRLALSPVQTLDEYWNSEELKSVRLQMLGGTLPERCINCSDTGNRALSYKDDMLARWPDEIEKAIVSTAPDGSTDLKPITFDYRSSTCNLRCRTCGPHSSTSAEIEARRSERLQQVGEESAKWDDAYLGRRAAAMSNARDDLMEAARERRIRHLYWAGGEPLMDETHWEVMAELVSSGEAANVDVAYNTNLTVSSYRGRKVEDIWPRFKSVFVQASIDGVGEAGEYIRTGFKTELFATHLQHLLELTRRHDHVRAVLDLTLTSVGLLHLGDFLVFAQERDIGVTAKLMVPRKINRYMAVEFLPRDVKDDWCRRWMGWISRNDRTDLFATVDATLDLALSRDTLQPARPDAHQKVFDAEVIAAFEEARRDSGTFRRLLSIDPRLDGLVG